MSQTIEVPRSYFDLIAMEEDHFCGENAENFCVRVASAAKLPTRFGNFIAVGFNQPNKDQEHAAFVKGDVVGKENVLVRLHSECLTGDGIGSLRCDCRDQLEGGLRKIEEEGEGVLLYLRQEGRGIGLTNKLKAYSLQDRGFNTVEANLALGFEDDERDYRIAAHMIKSLGIKSIRLMTNNPEKLIQLQRYGVNIRKREEHIFASNEFNESYLNTKLSESSHLLKPNMNASVYLTADQN